ICLAIKGAAFGGEIANSTTLPESVRRHVSLRSLSFCSSPESYPIGLAESAFDLGDFQTLETGDYDVRLMEQVGSIGVCHREASHVGGLCGHHSVDRVFDNQSLARRDACRERGVYSVEGFDERIGIWFASLYVFGGHDRDEPVGDSSGLNDQFDLVAKRARSD